MSESMDFTRGAGWVPTLLIKGWKDILYKKSSGEMEVAFDPETFNVDSTINLSKPPVMGSAAGGVKFARSGDSKLTVHILFDDTTVPDVITYAVKTMMPYDIMISDSVENMLTKFYKLVHSLNSTGSPNYLKITSSSMPIMEPVSGEFACILESMSVKTTLVSAFTGQRLKATVECVFTDAGSVLE